MAWIWTGLGFLEEQRRNQRMAKAKRSGFLTGVSGKLGDAVFRQMKDGTTIITKKPDFSNRQFSQDQLSHQDLVKLAAAYGKVASKENPIYAQKAEGTKKNAFNVAFADWFHPPVVHGIRYAADEFRIEVRDDVMVTRVRLTILDAEGNILEQGDATLQYGPFWEYRPASMGRIRVEAWDLPGNVTMYEFCQPPENQYSWEQETGMH
jgi:hypothetical protein